MNASVLSAPEIQLLFIDSDVKPSFNAASIFKGKQSVDKQKSDTQCSWTSGDETLISLGHIPNTVLPSLDITGSSQAPYITDGRMKGEGRQATGLTRTIIFFHLWEQVKREESQSQKHHLEMIQKESDYIYLRYKVSSNRNFFSTDDSHLYNARPGKSLGEEIQQLFCKTKVGSGHTDPGV